MWSSFYQQARGNVQGHGMFQRFQFVFQTGKTILSYIYSHHLFRIRSLGFKKRKEVTLFYVARNNNVTF